MNTSQIAAGAAVTAAGALANGGSMVLYSGGMPVSPETALSGDTSLCPLTLAATAFGAPTYVTPNMQAAASFTASSFTITANGFANFARVLESNGTVAVFDLTCIAPYQTVSFSPPLGFLCSNGGNTYKITTAGTTADVPPTGITTSTDGTAVWTYVGAGVLGDVVLQGSYLQNTTTINSPTWVLQQAAS